MLNKIKSIFIYLKSIPNKLILLFGLLIILYMLWLRFIRIRIPRDIYEEPSTLRTIILVLLCLVYMGLIIYSLRHILCIKSNVNSYIYIFIHKITENKYYTKIDQLYYNYISNSPASLYEFFYNFIYKKFNNYLSILGMLWYNFGMKCVPIHAYYIYIIFIIVPKSLVAFIFIIDIFYYKYLNYFYKSLFLLIIPIAFNLYVYMLNKAFFDYKEFFNKVLIITPVEDNQIHIDFKNKEDMSQELANYPTTKKNLDYLGFEMIKWNKMSSVLSASYKIRDDWKYYIYLFVYTSYFTGWSYYLLISYYPTYINIISNIYYMFITLILVVLTILLKYFVHDYYNTKLNKIHIYFKLYCYFIVYIIMLLLYIYISTMTLIILVILLYYINNFILLTLNSAQILTIKKRLKIVLIETYDEYIYSRIYLKPYVLWHIKLFSNYLYNKYIIIYILINLLKFIFLTLFIFNILYSFMTISIYYYILILSLIIYLHMSIYTICYFLNENIKHINKYINVIYVNNDISIELKPNSEGDIDDISKNYKLYVKTKYCIEKDNNAIKNYVEFFNKALSLIYIVICIYYILS